MMSESGDKRIREEEEELVLERSPPATPRDAKNKRDTQPDPSRHGDGCEGKALDRHLAHTQQHLSMLQPTGHGDTQVRRNPSRCP